MSAKTLDGVDVLRERMVEAAFDKAAFPSFGAVQTGTSGLIHRHLLRTHAASPSLMWPELQDAASTAPEMSGKQVEVGYGGSSVMSELDFDLRRDEYREYKFGISIDGEHLQSLALRYSAALEVHKASPREVSSTITFPNWTGDTLRNMTHNDANAEHRGQELLAYYRALFQRSDVIASDAYRRCIAGTALGGLDLGSLQAAYCRSYTKVAADPELVKRAMLYLRITGEVLCHDYEHVRFDTVSAAQSSDLRDMVFLRPQWLVDVMKELVHHDIKGSP